MYRLTRRIKEHSIIISIFSLMLIALSFGIVSIQFASGQASQVNSDKNNANPLNLQNIPAKKIHVGDIDIAYKVFGKGDPILLISGSGQVMDAWDHTILRDLSSNHTVIIFDNRGVGNTTAGTRPFSIIQFANDTIGLLDALKIQKADVLGFSMGTFIAQQLTVLHPEKVNRLVLYGASCGGKDNIPQSPEVVKILSNVVNNNTMQDQERLLSVTYPLAWIRSHPNFTIPQPKETISPNTLKKQFNIVEDWFATNWSGVCNQLSKITIPTLVITGTEDVAVPTANSLIIVQKIPGAWLVQIKGAGHGLMYQYPEKLSIVLQTFLTTTTMVPSN
ncbi:MAG: alpha/beta hydrolase [Nitrososphaeraceae archaeon]|nr:alpha/beta hydrolase [Nitrososphaeraceae archaeon]